MNYKQSRWEKEYDKFKAINKDDLTQKMAQIQREQAALKDGKEYGDKKNELAELKKALAKYERTEKNVDKIENILSFKKELVDKTFSLLEMKEKFSKDNSEIAKINNEITKLDEDRKKAVDRVVDIEAELKNPDIKDEDRAKLNSEKQEKLQSIQANDLKFSALSNSKADKTKALQGIDVKKVDQELLKNEQLLGKCDLIGANLVKGKNKDDITAALSNFKFTPNKDFAAKIKAMKEMQKNRENVNREQNGENVQEGRNNEDIFDEIDRGVQESIKQETPEADRSAGEVLAVSEFDKKHPRLAKIKNFFKNAYNNLKDRATRNGEGREAQPEEKPKDQPAEKPVEKPVKDKTDKSDFEYAMKHLDGKDDDKILGQIAEEGMSGFRKSVLVDKKTQYQEMKKAAAERYANQYGSRYNEQDGMDERDEK